MKFEGMALLEAVELWALGFAVILGNGAVSCIKEGRE